MRKILARKFDGTRSAGVLNLIDAARENSVPQVAQYHA
jgi:hypothetical protein